MLKETKTEETIVFFVTFLSLVAFQLGGGGPSPLPPPPLATTMVTIHLTMIYVRFKHGKTDIKLQSLTIGYKLTLQEKVDNEAQYSQLYRTL